jgi:hypothetical protein
VTAGGDHDHQDLSAIERHEVEVFEVAGLGGRGNRKAQLLADPRGFLGHIGEHVIEGARAAQARLDLRGRARGPAFAKELVHIAAIAEVCRNPTGRGVRLADVALLFEP